VEVRALNKDINETKLDFTEKINDAKSETLWRIQDAEELIKTRISEAKVETIRKQLEQESRQTTDILEGKMKHLVEKVYGELSNKSDLIEKNSNKRITDTNAEIMNRINPKIECMLVKTDLKEMEDKVDNMKRKMENEFE
jgi:hypothetical protein